MAKLLKKDQEVLCGDCALKSECACYQKRTGCLTMKVCCRQEHAEASKLAKHIKEEHGDAAPSSKTKAATKSTKGKTTKQKQVKPKTKTASHAVKLGA